MNTGTNYKIGGAIVTRVTEMDLNEVAPTFLYPEWHAGVIEEHASWLVPDNMSVDHQFLIQSIHTWVVRTDRHTILIDTASGNDKERPLNTLFHHLNTPYLERLKAVGVQPEDVDFVFITHLHVDHVGWNTILEDGKWVPTFPNAKYVFSKAEFDFYSNPKNVQAPSKGVFEDSVLPVVEAGQAIMIEADGKAFIDGFAFHRTPGHSYDHLSISLTSGTETALFGGDVMHHPIQVARPTWSSIFCEFQDKARASRNWALEYTADRNATFFSSHFAGSSAGSIIRRAERFEWHAR